MSVPGEGVVGEATRVMAGDDGTNYDAVAIAFHWATALLVLNQFALSQLWSLFGRPAHHVMVVAHMSFGIILAIVIVGRIAWRLLPGHQVPAIGAGWSVLAAKAVHYLLYALLASEAVLGFLLRWSGNESMSFFGLLIDPPFAPFSKAAQHQIGELHENVGWAIIILAAGHALAALYHHYVLKDRVLLRMLSTKSS
jgi:cytochrome b561